MEEDGAFIGGDVDVVCIFSELERRVPLEKLGDKNVLVSIWMSAKMKGDWVTLKVLYTSLKARAIWGLLVVAKTVSDNR